MKRRQLFPGNDFLGKDIKLGIAWITSKGVKIAPIIGDIVEE